MKTKLHPCLIEILESRIAPATLTVTAQGDVSYKASAGTTNNFAINISGNYIFTDTETITVTGAGAANFSGSGGNSVQASPSFVKSITVDLDDGNDSFTLYGLSKPLTVVDGPGNDTVTVPTGLNFGTVSANGTLSLAAETITFGSAVYGFATTIAADDFSQTAGFVYAALGLTVKPLTAGREMTIAAAKVPGTLSLTKGEVDNLGTGTDEVLELGSSTGGNLTISTTLSTVNGYGLSLKSGGDIVETGSGLISWVKPISAISTGGSVTLEGANNISKISGSAPLGFAYKNAGGINVEASGITTTTGTIKLTSNGSITQTGKLQGAALVLTGSGSATLTGTSNSVGTLASNLPGGVTYQDSDGITVGAAGGISGITTSNTDVTVKTTAGDVLINQPINSGSGALTLQAGEMFTGGTLTINAALTSSASTLALTALHLGIAAAITATGQTVSITPVDSITINLGADDFGLKMGLTSTELNYITADRLVIGSSSVPLAPSSNIAPAHINELKLIGSYIYDDGGGITVNELTLSATNSISLISGSDVNVLGIVSTSNLSNMDFTDPDGFDLGSSTGQTSFDLSGTNITKFNVGTGTLTLPSGTSLAFTVNGTTPGTAYDQIRVTGTVNINNATLNVTSGSNLPLGTEFVIIQNDGADDVTGTFNGLAEGDTVPGFSPGATITYHGGDGNDVAIVTSDPLGGTPTAQGFVFRDVDGDIVTVKSSIGTLTTSQVIGVATGGPNGAARFEKLKLDPNFAGANITITAKPSADGGNGFVNLGFLDATGVDLGNVSITGDIARVAAGTVGGDVKVPALKSLSAQSIGLLGDSTLAPADKGFIGIETQGAIGKLSVKDDLRGDVQMGDVDGNIGTVTIGGSFLGAALTASGSIGSVKITGDIRAGSVDTQITASNGTIGGITVDGGIFGADSGHRVIISAWGLPAGATGANLAIKNVTVKGSVQFASIEAGLLAAGNADASIGGITVGGDWIASSVLAGVGFGLDNRFGTADDEKFPAAVVDVAGVKSSIGSFVVKGQAFGTDNDTGDMFGVVAEQIGKANVGGRSFAFTKGANEAFFAAPTLDGEGTENPMFDFTIREIGAATPAGTIAGGVNLQLNGKTATFNDIDGDLVTIKRTIGTFGPGEIVVTPAASGGGFFTQLILSAAPGNLTITAKPGPSGGNGFVNLGTLTGTGIALGNVSLAGDLTQFDGGAAVTGKPGIGSLAAQSIGVFNVIGATPGHVGSTITGGLGKLTVKSDIRDESIVDNSFGDRIGAVSVGGALLQTLLQSEGSILGVKVGGSMIDSTLTARLGALGAIDVKGDAISSLFRAFGQEVSPGTGTDLAIKSLSIGGTFELSEVQAGSAVVTGFTAANADAAIGAITVGHGWLASSARAGVDPSSGTFIGFGSDIKAGGTPNDRDSVDLYSSIASITIKGQALGSPAGSDHFGIIAERIGNAKIGSTVLKLDKGIRSLTDVFAIAPTSPGLGNPALPFDFYLRELS